MKIKTIKYLPDGPIKCSGGITYSFNEDSPFSPGSPL